MVENFQTGWCVHSGFVRRPLVRGTLGGSGGAQLCSLRAARVPPGGVVGGEALRLAPPGAGVLVETLRELREEDEYEWQGVWRGCWGSGGCEVYAGGPRDGRS